MNTNARRIILTPIFENLSVLEDFISGCALLDTIERNKALLISSECFDNIISHSHHMKLCKVSVSLVKKTSVTLIFRYQSSNFTEMVRSDVNSAPYFDSSCVRYRGLGLRMCRNLASSIQYRKGLLKSSIIIIL